MAKKATLPESRELSQLEKDYLAQQYAKPGFDINDTLKKLPGVSKSVLEHFLSSVVPVSSPEENKMERLIKLNAQKAGQSVSRESMTGNTPGVVVMTERASEIADAHRVLNVPSTDAAARKQSDRIHIIDPSRKCK